MIHHISQNDILIERYLDVCNCALSENKDRFPFKQIFSAIENTGSIKTADMTVKGINGNNCYTITLKDQHLIFEPQNICHSCKCSNTWQINKTYLEDVVAHPDIYISNPAMINWEWLFPITHKH